MPVSEIQGHLEVTVVGCRDLKYTKLFSKQKPYAVLSYGDRTYKTTICKVEGKHPKFGDKFVIKPIERYRVMTVHVSHSSSIFRDKFIAIGKVKLDKVLSQGFDDTAYPLLTAHGRNAGKIHLIMKYLSEISGNDCNASSEIMECPSEIEELVKMEETSHPNNGDGRGKTNVEEVKILKSSGTFLNNLEKATPKRFSYEELKKFTSGFTYEVGSGGSGHVYKGQFLDGTEVAVKVLTANNIEIGIFEAEVFMMHNTSHRNLVKFYGYCFDGNMKALVFEYMKNGSLDKVLYKKHLSLEWEKLYKISIEIAKGLSYLHDGCGYKIIHHDVKASNVLLDSDLSPKITDFGSARPMSRSVSHITWTGIRGTSGYIAPEMCMPGSEITHKCDVYSFGIMMFEVLGMQRNGKGSKWFPKQVWSKFETGKLDEIIDDCGIHKKKDRENAKILSMVALWCAQHTAQARPNMCSVVKMLEGEIPVKKPPDPFLLATELFYSKVPSTLPPI